MSCEPAFNEWLEGGGEDTVVSRNAYVFVNPTRSDLRFKADFGFSRCRKDHLSVCTMSLYHAILSTLLIQCNSAVINYLVHQQYRQTTGVAFVYCSYKEKDGQSAVNLVASLLQQLIQRRAVMLNHLHLLYKQHSKRWTRPTLVECSRLLHAELNACSRAFIIVDALDECDEASGARHNFINQLLELPSNTSLMITSCEVRSIELRFPSSRDSR